MSFINSIQEVDWVNFECECNTPLIQLMNSPAVRYVAEEVDVEVRKYERPDNQKQVSFTAIRSVKRRSRLVVMM